MPSKLKGIVKVTKNQLETLISNGFIVVDEITHTYQPHNYLYITDEKGSGGDTEINQGVDMNVNFFETLY